MNYDKPQREPFLPKLMEHVRLPLLTREYLIERVETESLIKRSFACKDFLIEAMKYHLVPRFQRNFIQSTRTKSRAPVGFPKVLYVVGGQAPKAIRRLVLVIFIMFRLDSALLLFQLKFLISSQPSNESGIELL